ncbi:hypothetical protein WA026_014508 [Henosepilachna vigintioctopunctata]|uniref:Uncharacterized protein n=1 Tax=Henosepilachna vigintioctopunctata TaxID=420089 RepID=A0AAW1UIV5_9CUCU
MYFQHIFTVLVVLFGFGLCDITNVIPTVSTTSKSTGRSVDPFLPHATYLSANSYVDNVPYGVAYNAKPTPPAQGYQGYLTKIMPSAQTTLEVALWLFSKIGTVLFGSTFLFLIGGLFNALICTFTPLCAYDFHGFGLLNNESVRSLMTPDKISTAAALVQDAIGKYNRMQREMPN